MEIQLKRATLNDAELIFRMQKEAFAALLETYQDFETNPGYEPFQRTADRLCQDFTYFYLIQMQEKPVGAIRVVDTGAPDSYKRISPLFVLPDYCGQGIAQKAIQLAEELHGTERWQLSTILQEPKNCHLYEKMGYHQTGETRVVNDKLTLVYYEK